MSSYNNNPYNTSSDNASHEFNSNNPYNHPSQDQYAPPPGPPPQSQDQQQQQTYQQQPYQSQQPPQPQFHSSGPPTRGYPPNPNSDIPGGPPKRTGTFNEEQFVPDAERGEQREAFQQFEMKRNGPEDRTDQDVAQLQREFPSVDSSLIAALYGDSKDMGATREMLQELARSSG